MLKRFAVACVPILAVSIIPSPGPFCEEASDAKDNTAIARSAGDVSSQVASLERLLQDTPEPGFVMYMIARTYADAGDNARAIEWLQKVVALDLGFDPGADEAFAAARAAPEYRAIADRVTSSTPPILGSRHAFTVSGPGLSVEGLAYDPEGRRFFLSSLSTHNILEVDGQGKASEFASDLFPEVLGMKVDPRTNALWAASNGETEAAVFQYDLEIRQLLRKCPVSGKHTLNDLVVDSRGGVFVTDTQTGTLFHCAPGASSLVEFATGLRWANGIAATEDGTKLFVSHFSDGVSVVDVATRRAQPLARPAGMTLAAIDGLYLHQKSLIAVQNFCMQPRVVRFWLSPGLDRIERMETLERRNPLFDVPTTGALVGDEFYFIANSQLFTSRDKLQPVHLLKIKL